MKSNGKLANIYTTLKENNDTVSAMGGDYFAEVNPNKLQTALTWQLAGLYEPSTPEEQRLVEAALRDLTNTLTNFTNNLSVWQQKYNKIGSQDTVSQEQVAQYIAKSVLNLTELD